MKLFKIGKNVRIKILIWHMVGEMVKKWGRFYFHVFIPAFYTVHITLHITHYTLVKIKEVKLKNLHTLTCLNLSYGTTKQKTKMKS